MKKERILTTNDKRYLVAVFFLAFTVALLLMGVRTLTSAATPTPPVPYKVGYSNSFTGYMAGMGALDKLGTLCMLDIINKAGGINGHPINLVSYDDQSDPTQGVLAIKKLIDQDQVLTVVGSCTTSIASAQASVVDKSEVPFLVNCGGRWPLLLKWQMGTQPTRTEVRKWVFKLGNDEEVLLTNMYYETKALGGRRIAWINTGSAYGRGAKTYLKATAEKEGFIIAAEEEYTPTDTDMTAQLSRIIRKGNFDVLIVFGVEAAAALTVRQAKQLGITQPIVGTYPIANKDNMKVLGSYLQGVRVEIYIPDVAHLLPDTHPQKAPALSFFKAFKDMYKYNADYTEVKGGSALSVVAEALRQTRFDPNDVKEARRKIRDSLENLRNCWTNAAGGDMSARHEIEVPKFRGIVQGDRPVPYNSVVTEIPLPPGRSMTRK